MARVYVSSTYEDLKEYRLAARSAILGLDCHAVGMEDYAAGPKPPLEKCLEDLRSCQVYVGLFGWGYGSLAPGREKSFTHLEYEEAARTGLPCLIFLLHSSVDWPEQRKDPDPKNILELRKLLQTKHTTKWFHAPQQLETAVTQGIASFLSRPAQIRVPALLPYLGDRSIQRDELAEALQKHRANRPRRPFIALVHGSEEEAHDRFVDRLREKILPEVLETAPVHHKSLPWADPEGSLEERQARLRRNLAEALTGRREAGIEDLALQIASFRAPLLLSTSVSSRDWQTNEAELIRRWLAVWGEWPELPAGQTLLSFLSFKYENPESTDASAWWKKFSRRRRAERRSRELRAFVESLGVHAIEGATVARLSELQGIRESEVEELIEREVREFVTRVPGGRLDPVVVADDMKDWSSGFFDDWEARTDSPRAPMQLVARTLRHELERRINEGG